MNLSWLALALGALAAAYAAVRSRGTRTPLPGGGRLFFGAAALLIAAGALATLPTRPPWSPGQSLGPGFAAGGAAVLLVTLLSARLRGSAAEAAGWLGAAAYLGAAAVGVSAMLLLYRNYPLDALTGFALGAVTAGIVVGGGLLLDREGDEALAAAAEGAALAGALLAATTVLASLHRGATGVREWQSLPALLTGAAALVLAARGAFGPGRGGGLLLALLAAGPLVVAAAIGFGLNGTPGFFWTVLLGTAIFSLAAWLFAATLETERGRVRPELALLGSLLVLGGAALVFRWLHGYGLGLYALSGLFVALALDAWGRFPGREALRGTVAFAGLLVLYRVFYETVSYAVNPDYIYQHAALIAGALIPAALGVLAGRPGSYSGRSALGGALLAGAGAAAIPLALWLVLGERPQASFVAGLAVGAGFLIGLEQLPAGVIPRLTAFGMALTAVQFTHLLEPLTLVSRPQRIGILAGLTVLALLALAAAAWRERSVKPE
ncbi:MAG: hypothetical protein ACK47B_26815 [Armatimonadota bacterium]